MEQPITLKQIKKNIPGLVSPQVLQFLYDTPDRIGPGRYLEIGTLAGQSTAALALGLKNRGMEGRIVTVDTFDGFGLSKPYQRMVRTSAEVRKTLNDLKLYNIDIMCSSSVDAARAICLWDEKFDFIFIDGDHSFDGVWLDFCVWSHQLKMNGEIAFDDADQRVFGTKEVWYLMEHLKKQAEWQCSSDIGRVQGWRRRSP